MQPPEPVVAGDRGLRRTALALGGFALVEVILGYLLAVPAGFGWQRLLSTFMASNGLMGASFAGSGLLIAWHRPRNALSWLLIADGLGHATSTLAVPLAQLVHHHHGPELLLRSLITVFMFSWPWSITLFLPLALLCFPDGHLPSRRWRPVAWGIVISAPLFVAEMTGDPTPVADGFPRGYLTMSSYHTLSWLWGLSEARVLCALAVGVGALVVRYRSADETGRRQLLWLLLAGVVVVAAVLPWSFVAGTPVVVLFSIPLIPLAIGVAVVRHQLLDIRLVLSRAVAWLLLSLAALAAYGALVALLGTALDGAGRSSALLTALIAVALAPLLPRLQREVDRWTYGERGDPARVAERLGEHLAAGGERGLAGVVSSLRAALRLPYVALTDGESTLAADGSTPTNIAVLPLTYAGAVVGRLEIGLRPGEKTLDEGDLPALQLVAAPLAVALGALRLSEDLERSRSRIVVAREEERRRLRRDLHDGLGPTLTGLALAADAATNFLDREPEQSRELLGSLRRDTRTAIGEVRRLIDDLRPPVLDELGLVGALKERVDALRRRDDGSIVDVRLVAPEALPVLPAAAEVVAYRVATEALLNVTRHAGARGAVIEISCNGSLDVSVLDDGSIDTAWAPGVGLSAMRERAAEVGARFEAGPTTSGGRVFLSIPLAAT
jgi:two-component system NarL family sensor kinase